MRWVAEQAGELAIDPDRIAVGGDSAGGNLAAAVTLLAKRHDGPQLAAQLLIYPNTQYGADTASMRENDDPMHVQPALGAAGTGSTTWPSPTTAWTRWPRRCWPPITAGLPPALVITAEYDPLRDEGELYAERLRAAGVPVELSRYDGMMHGFFTMSGVLDGGRRAVGQAAEFLRQAVRSEPMTEAKFYSLDDFENGRSGELLPADVTDYFAGGSGSERALAANRSALDAISVYPRMLAGAAPDCATTMLSSLAAMPVAIAPMAYQRLAHPDGEIAMAKAARGGRHPDDGQHAEQLLDR